jgi:hypothetical protein
MINNYNESLIMITNDDQKWLKHDQTWSIIIMINNDQNNAIMTNNDQ